MFQSIHKNLFSRPQLPPGKYLIRDYIYNALYNPNYGYFNKYAKILKFNLDPKEIKDINHFDHLVAKIYQEAIRETWDINKNDLYKQLPKLTTSLWHTPSELFSPIYGQLMANYVIEQYEKRCKHKNCTILEVGAGNATMMNDILDFIQRKRPDLYPRFKYQIVDISPFKINTKHKNVSVVHDSILNLRKSTSEYHIVLLNEVLDNFAFDCIRFKNKEPYQGYITYDPNAGLPNLVFTEDYTKLTDYQILKLFNFIDLQPSLLDTIKSKIPFSYSLSKPYFIPTQINYLFQIIKTFLPNHSILIADFDHLPDCIPGSNAPRIHAHVDGKAVTVPSLCVHPGPFDIFFPIDFQLMIDLYKQPDFFYPISSRINQQYFSYSSNVDINLESQNSFKESPTLLSHKQFCQLYLKNCDHDFTLQDKSNPLLDFYQNFKVLTLN